MSKKAKNNKNIKMLAIIAVAALTLVIIAIGFKTQNNANSGTATSSDSEVATAKDSDIVIQVKDVTEEPTFIPAEIDGTKMEVIAVKASDGSIRTAFNTCQVCYDSGRGYYEVEGDKLVCQNCGNSFDMDDVAVTKGGCNPVPITEEYKTVSDDTITISKDTLTQAATMFGNWK